ncbi:MAG: hypothetical protein G01um101438_528 [Parcubacteria group bacterium Gr01-1014_38]|nr:MAG: hypothetical protein G01um101438_528 [Parcubacteria group bacterium Gr01-1014_38]
MRVLFVAALPPERSSMVGRILPLAQEVHAAGHAVEILTLSGARRGPYTERRDVGGIRLRTVGPALRATDEIHPHPVRTFVRFLMGHTALARALATAKADVVILEKPQPQNTFPALSFAQRVSVPLVLDLDDLEAEASRLPALFRWAFARLESQAVEHAAVVTVASAALAEHVRALRPRVRMELVPTGARLPPTIPNAHLRERLGLPADAKVILYVGSLSIASGHRVDHLLDAFAKLAHTMPNVHLVLAGNGLDEQRLRATARSLPPAANIHFLGRFTPPSDFALAHDADLLVDPVDRSLTNQAKSSHRVLLALATGTPIVAGAVGIRPLMLPPALHVTCLYDPDDPDALRAALARGLHESVRDHFRLYTADRIHPWTWPVLGPRFVHLLQSVARSTS